MKELGLYLLGQRWYDSEVGRFISRDPILLVKSGIFFKLFLFTSYLKWGSYLYALNQPNNLRDPKGLFTEEECRQWYLEDLEDCEEWYEDCIDICRDTFFPPARWICLHYGCNSGVIICRWAAYTNLSNCLCDVEKE